MRLSRRFVTSVAVGQPQSLWENQVRQSSREFCSREREAQEPRGSEPIRKSGWHTLFKLSTKTAPSPPSDSTMQSGVTDSFWFTWVC